MGCCYTDRTVKWMERRRQEKSRSFSLFECGDANQAAHTLGVTEPCLNVEPGKIIFVYHFYSFFLANHVIPLNQAPSRASLSR
jgi:hypothetical protein